MKRLKHLIFSTLLATAGFIVLQSFETGAGKKDGTEPGYTGSPGDSLKNCTVCHGGTAVDVEGWIVSDVPSTGFVPGEQYTITATNTEHGATRFGFSISPQALDGTMLGTMVITDTVTTKLVGDGKYATYRADGVEGVDSRSWSFDWIAPAGVNEVIFYGAFNSNADGHKDGDKTYLSTLRIYKNGFTGIRDLKNRSDITIFPTLVSDVFYVHPSKETTGMARVTLTAINGQQTTDLGTHQLLSNSETRLNLPQMDNGIYFVHITPANGKQSFTQKIVINQ